MHETTTHLVQQAVATRLAVRPDESRDWLDICDGLPCRATCPALTQRDCPIRPLRLAGLADTA